MERNLGRSHIVREGLRLVSAFSARGLLLATLMALLASCSSRLPENESVQRVQDALSPDQLAVLGFERPTSDWSRQNGALAESTTVTQGAKALAVIPSGWTEITSVALSSLGPVKTTLSVDVRASAKPTFGELRAILIAPSLGMSSTDLGGQSLTGLTPGTYKKISFALPAAVKAALESSYTDLKIRLVLNTQTLAQPYLIDNLDLSAIPGGGTLPAPDDVFTVLVPQGESRETMLLSASEFLLVDDRVELGVAGKRTNVAGLGTLGSELGSALKGHTNVYAGGRVYLRSQAVVEGFVRTPGLIDKQDATVLISGGAQSPVPVPTRTFQFRVRFPSTSTPLATVESGTDLTLAPGAYKDLNMHGGRVFLKTGTYYFDSLTVEPAGQIRIDNFNGPIFIYVKNSFTYKGPFVDNGARPSQLFVGYLGSTTAILQAPYLGTMVAPNAKIELQRPGSGRHRGSWFGKRIEVFSDSQILQVPFDWPTLPGGGDATVPDTDGDGTDDLHDVCVLDPSKTTDPGLCGCGKPETDDDVDTVPNCIDPCPNDPNNVTPGPCGCVGQDNLQPAGTRCVVEACSGSRQEATCNAFGQCGSPSCSPMPSCVYREYGDSGYWFCTGNVTWQQAETACKAQPRRSLVEIDSRPENIWVSRVLSGAAAWLGGSDQTTSFNWFWSTAQAREGTLFWQNGLPIRGRYANWALEKPGIEHCQMMQAGGTWADAACSSARGFVCEQPLVRLPPAPPPLRLCDFYPNVACGPAVGGSGGGGGCVDEDTVFPHTLDPDADRTEVERISQECFNNCKVEGAPGCSSCEGFASVPPPGSCQPFSAQEKAFCDLAVGSVHPTATCSIATPACPAGYVCGRRRECAALDANFEPHRCDGDPDCPAGQVCGHAVKVCIDPAKRSKCQDKNAAGECVGLCFGSLACGQAESTCAGTDDDSLISRCSNTELCPDPGTVDLDTDPLSDPDSNLTPQVFPAATFFPEPVETPAPYPIAKPAGCGGDKEPDCDYPVGEHPWCKYQVDPAEKPAARAVSDSDPAFGDKQGTGGGSGPIRFDFDPNLSISYDIEEPLPLGDSKFRAGALAAANAGAHFSLFGINGDVSILDALASLEVDRCGLAADAHLKLFGYDFLPTLLGADLTQALDDVDTSQETRDTCQKAIDDFKGAVNRAQKALRDAQELVRQEKELVANGKRLPADLCTTLLASATKGLPEGFPTRDAPFKSCDNVSPEDTINLFVRYYKQQIFDLIAEQAKLLQGGLPEIPAIHLPFLDSVQGSGSVDDARRETQQIANITFPIGPIPLNLSIEAFVQYGVAGALDVALTPQNLLTAYQLDTKEQLASVNATVTPFAGAGVSMFLGVGFSFGPLAAKAGISGDVSLGIVSLPIYAAAGVHVQPEVDNRALPPDLDGMVTSAQVLFPPGVPKKYRFDADYKFGANATISNILSGSVAAKLKIKFFWFSKTWSKTVARFDSPFAPIDIHLINAGGDASLFASDFGILGAVRMPLPFVDLNTLDTPPPLPPLPPTGGTGGTGTGGGGSGGSSGGTGGASGGTGGSGRPPVSLFVLNDEADPRVVPLDMGRVDQLFYDGYCACSGEAADCKSDRDCCGDSFCVFDDQPGVEKSQCRACIERVDPDLGAGQRCQTSAQCCQDDPNEREVKCYPRNGTGQFNYCQACKDDGDFAEDADHNGAADHDECCAGLHIFYDPLLSGQPRCVSCRKTSRSCNTVDECCPVSGSTVGCTNHLCTATPIVTVQ